MRRVFHEPCKRQRNATIIETVVLIPECTVPSSKSSYEIEDRKCDCHRPILPIAVYPSAELKLTVEI